MACWSAENATNAYLQTMKMGKSANEPNGAAFISALAAGNNARFTVVACGGPADSTTLALAAAAHQTGGRIVCILPDHQNFRASQLALGQNAANIEFVHGDAKELLSSQYKDSDFVAVDCKLESHETIISAIQEKIEHHHHKNCIVLGYNAFCKETWRNRDLKTQLLPIGEGLLMTKSKRSTSNWVVRVDKCTGEEHVFRVRSSEGRFIRA
ncbi:molecular chaperone Hsp31 and glyoxalase 3 [Striga asiatica]|uniref:Molecular chaperone Hsp31 and glyoxalase 3 n=1 Tax=Striga asiatica TaxID=4170 RepID=A0A5A7PRX2_STRAF|nr:molecular chaperone Hsp31 and glyoxalase 3 [Striga asiatica]